MFIDPFCFFKLMHAHLYRRNEQRLVSNYYSTEFVITSFVRVNTNTLYGRLIKKPPQTPYPFVTDSIDRAHKHIHTTHFLQLYYIYI